jgi:hypothetical protein
MKQEREVLVVLLNIGRRFFQKVLEKIQMDI